MNANRLPNNSAATATRRTTVAIAVVLAIAVGLQFVQLCRGPRGDFPNHWEFGRRMAAGEMIYAHGLNVVYPPLWSLVHAPLTLLPAHTAQLVVFPLFVVALATLLWTLRQLTVVRFDVDRDTAWLAAAMATLLAGRFLFRDMVECGANLALVALTWLGIYCWTKRKEWAGGLCLGLAISLKCTPLAMLAYFCWKRQWKMVAATLLATMFFTLVPAIWMGPSRFCEAMSLWSSYAIRGISAADPTSGVLGQETLQNLSLRPALASLLMSFLESTQPTNGDAIGLSPAMAGVIVKALLLLIALAVAWQFRHRVVDRESPEMLWECAAISLAMLLYSPITWTQHCVGVLPCLYLLILSRRTPGAVPAWCWGVVVVYVLAILVLNRAVLGRELALLLLSYHVHTWSILGLLSATLACHHRAVASGAETALAKIGGTCTLRPEFRPTPN